MQTIKEKIQQRRLQILVHSCIYYKWDDNIISDAQWNKWAHELVELQKKYPEKSKLVIYYEQFKDFDGSTGMDLPIDETWVMDKASELLWIAHKYPDDLYDNGRMYYLDKKSLKLTGNVKKSVSKSPQKASKQANFKKKRLF